MASFRINLTRREFGYVEVEGDDILTKEDALEAYENLYDVDVTVEDPYVWDSLWEEPTLESVELLED